MTSRNKIFDKYIPTKDSEAYKNAVIDFTKLTMQDPSFFNKSQEEQIAIAKSILKVSKGDFQESEKNN